MEGEETGGMRKEGPGRWSSGGPAQPSQCPLQGPLLSPNLASHQLWGGKLGQERLPGYSSLSRWKRGKGILLEIKEFYVPSTASGVGWGEEAARSGQTLSTSLEYRKVRAHIPQGAFLKIFKVAAIVPLFSHPA